jgi:hypothetical protein
MIGIILPYLYVETCDDRLFGFRLVVVVFMYRCVCYTMYVVASYSLHSTHEMCLENVFFSTCVWRML